MAKIENPPAKRQHRCFEELSKLGDAPYGAIASCSCGSRWEVVELSIWALLFRSGQPVAHNRAKLWARTRRRVAAQAKPQGGASTSPNQEWINRLAQSDDVVIWHIDLNGGMDPEEHRSHLEEIRGAKSLGAANNDWIATDPDEATRMLNAVSAIVNDRRLRAAVNITFKSGRSTTTQDASTERRNPR